MGVVEQKRVPSGIPALDRLQPVHHVLNLPERIIRIAGNVDLEFRTLRAVAEAVDRKPIDDATATEIRSALEGIGYSGYNIHLKY